MPKQKLQLNDDDAKLIIYGISSGETIVPFCWALNKSLKLKLVRDLPVTFSPVKNLNEEFERYTYLEGDYLKVTLFYVRNSNFKAFKNYDYLLCFYGEDVDPDSDDYVHQLRNVPSIQAVFTSSANLDYLPEIAL